MPKTSAEVLIDFTPKSKINVKCEASNNNPQIGYINNIILESDIISNDVNYATLEHNIFLLDGTIYISTSSSEIYSYFGDEISDYDCNLKNSNIKLIFSDDVSIQGITIYFDKIICPSLIEYSTNQNYPNKVYQITDSTKILININKLININILKTRFPGMHPRLFGIELGFKYNFTGKDIISLIINEEISPITNVLPVNTAELVVYNNDDNINILLDNKVEYYNIPVTIYYIIDDKRDIFSCFYIDKIEIKNKYEIKFSLVSVIKYLYDNSITPECLLNLNLSQWIQYILSDIYPYTISEEIPSYISNANKIIIFEKTTIKDLLQQVLFVYGLFVTCFNNILEIKKLDTSKNIHKLSLYQIIDNSVNIKKNNDICSVKVDIYDYNNQIPPNQYYSLNQYDFTTIYQNSITEDSLYLEFERPVSLFRYKIYEKILHNNQYILKDLSSFDITASNTLGEVIKTRRLIGDNAGKYESSIGFSDPGTGDESNTLKYSYYNFIDPSRRRLGWLNCTLYPNNTSYIENYKDPKYIFKIDVAYFTKYTYTYTIESISAEQNKNLLYITTPKIFNSINVKYFAQNILNYYTINNSTLEFSYINGINGDILHAGDTVYAHIDNNTVLKTTIVKQSIDISNGFVTKITGITNAKNIIGYEYMESNSNGAMYMNDNNLI